MIKSASVAAGTEIAVLSGASGKPGLDFVAAAFQKETGRAVRITYNTGARGIKSMLDDAVFDVMIAASDSIERNFRPAGIVEDGGINIGRVGGLGIMVRPGAPLPDISSVEALKRAVLEAESILYTTETTGLYIEGMLEQMGIYEQMQAKTTRCHNAPEIMERLLRGSGREFAFLSINLILSYREKGVVLVGPLPEEVQHYYEFIAVPLSKSINKDAAWEFARFCGGPGKPLLVAHGFK